MAKTSRRHRLKPDVVALSGNREMPLYGRMSPWLVAFIGIYGMSFTSGEARLVKYAATRGERCGERENMPAPEIIYRVPRLKASLACGKWREGIYWRVIMKRNDRAFARLCRRGDGLLPAAASALHARRERKGIALKPAQASIERRCLKWRCSRENIMSASCSAAVTWPGCSRIAGLRAKKWPGYNNPSISSSGGGACEK